MNTSGPEALRYSRPTVKIACHGAEQCLAKRVRRVHEPVDDRKMVTVRLDDRGRRGAEPESDIGEKFRLADELAALGAAHP
jgi:hypothetical protein